MKTVAERPVEERLVQVLRHLGVAQAHMAARLASDWIGLAMTHPEKAYTPFVIRQTFSC